MSLFGVARFAHFLAPAAVARFLALRSKVTRSTKRDANGKVISIKMNGGDLMMSVEWIDAPACTGGSVIGHTQELQVTDFLRDYKVQQISYVSKK